MVFGTQRLCVNLQPDGDLLYVDSALWTMAHYRVPVLVIVVNNRRYGNTWNHAVNMAQQRERGHQRVHIGSALDDPHVDYVELAQAYGVWAAGPVTTPGDVVPIVTQAIEVVSTGRPAVVEVITTE